MKKVKENIYKTISYKNKKIRTLVICLVTLNLLLMVIETFDISSNEKTFLRTVDAVLDSVFFIEFLLRLWTFDLNHMELKPLRARFKYLTSFRGLVDFVAVLPFFLPNFVSESFEVLRIARVFSVLKVSIHSTVINKLFLVFKKRGDELKKLLIAEAFFVSASAIVVYHAEHAAQPEIFKNAFSSFWWVFVAITTIGYGDIYPVTAIGKFLSVIIFLTSIVLVAIITTVIASEFVNQNKDD